MTKHDWIPAGDRLPDYGATVLIFATFGDGTQGECFVAERRRTKCSDPSRDEDYWSGEHCLPLDRVTHWIPVVAPEGKTIF